MQDKIICDYCGTIYSASARKCPICGNVVEQDAQPQREAPRAQNAKPRRQEVTFQEDFLEEEQPKPAPQKAPKAQKQPVAPKKAEPAPKQKKAKKTKPKRRVTKGAVITLVILLVAVIALGVFIFLEFRKEFSPDDLPLPTASAATQPVGGEIPCTAIRFGNTQILLDAAGKSELLELTLSPENTTEELIFISADPSVATVSPDGLVTAVAGGTTRITVTCGAVTATCTVVCEIPETPTTAETTEPEPESTDGAPKASHTDVTLFEAGETFTMSVSGYSSYEITWSSEDESIAKVSGGRVTAVAEGTTIIHAEVDGYDLECIVRCNFR